MAAGVPALVGGKPLPRVVLITPASFFSIARAFLGWATIKNESPECRALYPVWRHRVQEKFDSDHVFFGSGEEHGKLERIKMGNSNDQKRRPDTPKVHSGVPASAYCNLLRPRLIARR